MAKKPEPLVTLVQKPDPGIIIPEWPGPIYTWEKGGEWVYVSPTHLALVLAALDKPLKSKEVPPSKIEQPVPQDVLDFEAALANQTSSSESYAPDTFTVSTAEPETWQNPVVVEIPAAEEEEETTSDPEVFTSPEEEAEQPSPSTPTSAPHPAVVIVPTTEVPSKEELANTPEVFEVPPPKP